jgi:hypothetical protein
VIWPIEWLINPLLFILQKRVQFLIRTFRAGFILKQCRLVHYTTGGIQAAFFSNFYEMEIKATDLPL